MKEPIDEQQFARKIAEQVMLHRLKKGLSKLTVAQKAGIDQRTVTFIETGVNVPSVVTLFSICRAIGVDVTKIVRAAAKGDSPKL